MSFLIFLVLSCSSAPVDPDADKFIGREMWTATNLRLFREKNIYWTNYLDGEVLPVGTCIRLTEITSEYATFIDRNDREFTFYWQTRDEPNWVMFKKEVHKYFTFEDPASAAREAAALVNVE